MGNRSRVSQKKRMIDAADIESSNPDQSLLDVYLGGFPPDIDIAVKVAERAFLERMAAIGEQRDLLTVEQHFGVLKDGKLDIVNFRYRGDSPHTGLGCQLLARDDSPGRILVEVRARHWDCEPISYEVYVKAARSVLSPVLQAYNSAFSTRYRLRIQKPGREGFRISSRTRYFFERFAIPANTSSLHIRDWERFYEFVRESRQELPEEQVCVLLRSYGFSDNKAVKMADLYRHLWRFKHHRI